MPLLFVERGWGHAWLAFTTFSVAFMVTRVALGHLPDRVGGAKVALICMLIEAAGLAVIWRASDFNVALAGVTVSGLGYSLVYPGLGVEAVRSAPPHSRGVAMGTYLGSLVARRIAGDREDHALLDRRFPAIPLYRGTPWFLPFVGAYGNRGS